MSSLNVLTILSCLNLFVQTGLCDLRIVGGRPAEKGELPFQVGLRSTTTHRHFCGGSIISPTYILSAAHCIVLAFDDLYVQLPSHIIYIIAGQIELNRTAKSIVRSVEHILPHENYDPMRLYNDIALIKLKLDLPVKEKSLINAISIAQNSVASGSCITSGWGVTKYGSSKLNPFLYLAQLEIINFDQCKALYYIGGVDITQGMLCAWSSKGNDACQGDSGGPLTCNGVLTGIVSFGVGCANPQYPTVYTNVAYHKEWIDVSMERIDNYNTSEKNSTESNTNTKVSNSSNVIISSQMNILLLFLVMYLCR